MKKLNITPGKWFVRLLSKYGRNGNYTVESNDGQWGTVVCSRSISEECPKEYSDNLELIADAGNTYHATQMLPSEMAERIKALEDGIADAIESWNDGDLDTANIGRLRALLTQPIDKAHEQALSNPE
jgi:hypothetical protein